MVKKTELITKKTIHSFLILAVSVFLTAYAIAAEPQKATITQSGNQSTSDQSLPEPLRASQILGTPVNNPDGPVGKIEDLVIGEGETIKYAILSHGGFLGIGDKLIPIPWKALRWGPDKKTLMVNITKTTLEKSPNFDPKKWPDFAKPDWETKMQAYYELPPAQTAKH